METMKYDNKFWKNYVEHGIQLEEEKKEHGHDGKTRGKMERLILIRVQKKGYQKKIPE